MYTEGQAEDAGALQVVVWSFWPGHRHDTCSVKLRPSPSQEDIACIKVFVSNQCTEFDHGW